TKAFAEIAIEIDCRHVRVPLGELIFKLVLRQRVCRRRNLPGPGVDGADGGAGDVSIMQRLEVEIKTLDGAEPFGQTAQQSCELARLCLRLRHADGLEPKGPA